MAAGAPHTLQMLTAALLAGLMGRAGSMQFPAIPEPAQMSPLIFCCVGSLALPAPCHSLHSTGWRGVRNNKAEPAMAAPTSARSLPISGRIPPASHSLGALSFPKHRFHARTHIFPAHPCSLQMPNLGQATLPGWGQALQFPPQALLVGSGTRLSKGLRNKVQKTIPGECSRASRTYPAHSPQPCWGSGIRTGMAAQVLLEKPQNPQVGAVTPGRKELGETQTIAAFLQAGAALLLLPPSQPAASPWCRRGKPTGRWDTQEGAIQSSSS